MLHHACFLLPLSRLSTFPKSIFPLLLYHSRDFPLVHHQHRSFHIIVIVSVKYLLLGRRCPSPTSCPTALATTCLSQPSPMTPVTLPSSLTKARIHSPSSRHASSRATSSPVRQMEQGRIKQNSGTIGQSKASPRQPLAQELDLLSDSPSQSHKCHWGTWMQHEKWPGGWTL